jgi:three-Cys-motif partner protein
MTLMLPSGEELQHLKRVSRIKHIILEKYFPPWAKILGSRSSELAYIDCFAGPGQYEMEGQPVKGSPIIAVEEAIKLVKDKHVQRLLLHLVDDDSRQVERLEVSLKDLQPYPGSLTVKVTCANSRSFVPEMLRALRSQVPAFFLIDPYGHPLPLSVIRNILRRPRTEVLINLMWFQINRDLSNPKVETRLNELFGDNEWHNQPFLSMHGIEREKAFLTYFISKLGASFVRQFRIRYDVEDTRGGDGTKYYLLHASNHVKAALLMKEVMWPLGDEQGTFDYSGES